MTAELGEFLRSRRARLSPQEAGLQTYGRRRRVPGLRREELAQLAGVSVAYYTRLEQGNGQNVSSSVLEAVARALRLDEPERAHLMHLARPVRRSPRQLKPQKVRPQLRVLLDTIADVPAYIVGRRTDILAWNRLARALLADFDALPPGERNMARLVFLDPNSRDLYTHWEEKAKEVVNCLRFCAGQYPDDPKLIELVGELSMRSEEFRKLWAAYGVEDKRHGVKQFSHPLVGPLTLAYESLLLPDDAEQYMVTFHAEPGSPDADALRLLSAWGSTSQEPARS
ncbi:helix-turn-helix transcriptional regulator [Longispora albida]|uniref:helix-turn-helix transcriptional regulator n=1 Tax=Longispora albida TaxID=203523 RepID=UPI0003772766|nr:helix-turn-helix transcriptional regulator [Longispora albida]